MLIPVIYLCGGGRGGVEEEAIYNGLFSDLNSLCSSRQRRGLCGAKPP